MNLATIDNTIIMAGHEVFMRSDDGGANWKAITTNLPDHDIHGFDVSPNDPRTFFAFIVSYGLWRSDDAGVTWTLISNNLTNLRQVLQRLPSVPPEWMASVRHAVSPTARTINSVVGAARFSCLRASLAVRRSRKARDFARCGAPIGALQPA